MSVQLGPFRLIEPVARGGMAEVWKGVHDASGVPVAVKVMTGQLARLDKYRAQFKNEVRAMARLSHVGVIHVLDYGEIDAAIEAEEPRLAARSPYLVMEFAGGGSLFTQKGPFSWPRLRGIVVDLLNALAHAHARGMVHRDVKPGNVLFAAPGDLRPGLKLTDFGIARGLDLPAVRNPEDDRSGTLHYMSPEQLLGLWRDQGPWTDLYSVGCLAWRLASGHPPFHGITGEDLIRAQLAKNPPKLVSREPVPDGFVEWLQWLLLKEPRERFQSAADASAALLALGAPESRRPRPLPSEDDTISTVTVRPWRPGPPKVPDSWEPTRRTAGPPRGLVGAGLGLFPLRHMPLVGRRAERTVLWDALRKVHKDGRVEVVLVHGPSGIGKSRLVEWIATRAAEVGAASVLKATADADSTRGAAIARMVERHLRTTGLNREDLAQRVSGSLGVPIQGFECEALVDVVLPDPARTRNPELRTAVLRRFVARTCRERPVLLWLDDATRDVDALAFALDLIHNRDTSRMAALVAITVRDDVPEEWERTADLRACPQGVQVLAVGPLPPLDHHALVEELLVLDGPLAARIEERTSGHPGFAVQLVRELVERGALSADEGGFRVPSGVLPELPDDLHQTWLARIDQVLAGLPAEAGSHLERAAALGVEVPLADLYEIIGLTALEPSGRLHDASRIAAWRSMQSAVDLVLDRLYSQGLVEESGTGFAFRHSMLRESLERRAREGGRLEGHHRACAEMLAQRTGADVAERIGRHLLLAGDPAGAIDPLFAGTRTLATSVGFRSALALLGLAEEAMTRAALPEADPRWGRAWTLRAELAFRAGDLTGGLGWIDRAIVAAEKHGWQEVFREALVLQVPALLFVRGPEAAEGAGHDLVARATAANDTGALIAGLRALSDVAAARREDAKAVELARQAADMAAKHKDLSLRASCLRTLGVHAIKRREFARARAAFEASAAICERIGSRSGYGDAWLGLAHTDRLAGALEPAFESYVRALDALETVGSGNAAVCTFYVGLMRWGRGEPEEARAVIEALLPSLASRGWRRMTYGAHGVLAACAVDLGDWAAFDEHMEALAPVRTQRELADEDLAVPLERAGDRAAKRNQRERAGKAWSMAADLWAALGDAGRAHAIRGRMLGG